MYYHGTSYVLLWLLLRIGVLEQSVPPLWLSHLIHVLSYVLLISTIDDGLISTVGWKRKLEFTSLPNYLREVTPHCNSWALLPEFEQRDFCLGLHFEFFWCVDDLFIGIAILLYWVYVGIDLIYFLAPIHLQVKGGALEEGALVGRLTLCQRLGFVYQGVILSRWFFISRTFFLLHIPFDCLVDWFLWLDRLKRGAKVIDGSKTTKRSCSKTLIWSKGRHSSSYLSSSTRTRYIS